MIKSKTLIHFVLPAVLVASFSLTDKAAASSEAEARTYTGAHFRDRPGDRLLNELIDEIDALKVMLETEPGKARLGTDTLKYDPAEETGRQFTRESRRSHTRSYGSSDADPYDQPTIEALVRGDFMDLKTGFLALFFAKYKAKIYERMFVMTKAVYDDRGWEISRKITVARRQNLAVPGIVSEIMTGMEAIDLSSLGQLPGDFKAGVDSHLQLLGYCMSDGTDDTFERARTSEIRAFQMVFGHLMKAECALDLSTFGRHDDLMHSLVGLVKQDFITYLRDKVAYGATVEAAEESKMAAEAAFVKSGIYGKKGDRIASLSVTAYLSEVPVIADSADGTAEASDADDGAAGSAGTTDAGAGDTGDGANAGDGDAGDGVVVNPVDE